MKKIAMSALMVGALGLASVATTSPAEAHWRGGWGGWLGTGDRRRPGCRRRDRRACLLGVRLGTGLWLLRLRRPYAYDYGYGEPYRWGGGYTTTYYTAPVSYGYRYRRVVRPAFAYYRGSYPVVRHHSHRHYWHW